MRPDTALIVKWLRSSNGDVLLPNGQLHAADAIERLEGDLRPFLDGSNLGTMILELRERVRELEREREELVVKTIAQSIDGAMRRMAKK